MEDRLLHLQRLLRPGSSEMDNTLERVPLAPSRPRPILPPTPVFVAGFVIAVGLHAQWSLSLPAGAWRAAVGWWLVALGTAVFVWSVVLFTRASTGLLFHQPTRRLITSGPYAWSRNPQYVGFASIYLGLSLVVGSVWPLVLLPALVAIVTLAVIRPEERYLHRELGPPFADYCGRVRRWL
jgi:protein-S-isoprenylcysteine O-methyltransferase Ste14